MKTFFRFSSWMAILIIASIVGIHAQNAFFPTKQGMVLLYERKNGNGKTEGFSRTIIKNVEGSGNNMTISYESEILNKDKKSSNPPVVAPLKMVIKNGVMIFDMQEFLAGGNTKTPQAQMEVTGMPMELPSNLQAGQSIKDADVTMSIDMGIMKMKTVIKITDGKCLAIEDVTVAAGTFNCHKISQTITTTVMGRTVTGRSITWYAPGVGNVKTESYNDKDKLQASIELAEMK